MNQMPVYRFDYSLPPGQRWSALPKKLCKAGRTVARLAMDDIQLNNTLEAIALALRVFTKGRNPYRSEIKACAGVLGLSYHDAMISNFLYEISQISGFGYDVWVNRIAPAHNRVKETLSQLKERMMACTAGACMIEGLGMTHVRSMDWPLDGLGKHTLILHHVNNPAGDFYSIGWPGYCGVLSGFKPGKFSATINQATMLCKPNLEWPPAHLLRWVFENCTSYNQALEVLKATPVCVHAFILLASPRRAAVIEMAPNGNSVHPMKKTEPLVIANDYLSARKRTDDAGYSDHRKDSLKRRMSKIRSGTMLRALRLLQARPIQHEYSMQQMVFAHGAKSMLVVGRELNHAVAEALI